MTAPEFDVPSSITEAAAAIRSGGLTSVALVRACLDRIARDDGKLGAMLAVFEESALAAAAVADAELARGHDRGPLHGVPVGVKDILPALEGPTTAQSSTLPPNWGSGRDAEVVRRLREAGAIVVGKTSTMEFAIGVPDPDKPYAPPRNPWDLLRWAGGSSSGSGSGVAAGFFLGAIGTDTAGSVRIPAAFCGISGLKPTFGLVPTDGVIPLGFSLDHVGPMARTAADCAVLLECFAGTAAPLMGDLSGLRVGVLADAQHLPNGTAPEVLARFAGAVDVLRSMGADARDVSLPMYDEVDAAGRISLVVEALAYHGAALGSAWSDHYVETREIVGSGALVSAADYVRAQRVRSLARDAVRAIFTEVDVLVSPTAVMTAPPIDGLTSGLLPQRVHTRYWDVLGNPVLALPIGPASDGLPLSLQIIGRPHDDARVLSVGHAFQQRTDWHRGTPPGKSAGSPWSAPPQSGLSLPEPTASDVTRARGLCAAAGLCPSADELHGLARHAVAMDAMADLLRAKVASRDLPAVMPALDYDPAR